MGESSPTVERVDGEADEGRSFAAAAMRESFAGEREQKKRPEFIQR